MLVALQRPPSDIARQRDKKCTHQQNDMLATKVVVANPIGESIRKESENHIEIN